MRHTQTALLCLIVSSFHLVAGNRHRDVIVRESEEDINLEELVNEIRQALLSEDRHSLRSQSTNEDALEDLSSLDALINAKTPEAIGIRHFFSTFEKPKAQRRSDRPEERRRWAVAGTSLRTLGSDEEAESIEEEDMTSRTAEVKKHNTNISSVLEPMSKASDKKEEEESKQKTKDLIRPEAKIIDNQMLKKGDGNKGIDIPSPDSLNLNSKELQSSEVSEGEIEREKKTLDEETNQEKTPQFDRIGDVIVDLKDPNFDAEKFRWKQYGLDIESYNGGYHRSLGGGYLPPSSYKPELVAWHTYNNENDLQRLNAFESYRRINFRG